MSDFVIRPITGQPIAAVAGPARAVVAPAPVGQSGGGGAAQDGADMARSDGRDRPLLRRSPAPRAAAPDIPGRPSPSQTAAPEPPAGSELARIALSKNQVGPPPAFPINVLEAEAQRRATRDRAEASETARSPAPKKPGLQANKSQDHSPPGLAEAPGASPAQVQAPYPGQPVSPAAPSGTGPPPRVDLHL